MSTWRIDCLFAIVLAGVSSVEAQNADLGRDADGKMLAYRLRIPGSQVGIDMVPIPGGTLRLDEERSVEIAPLWIGKFEVTLEQYAEFMKMYDVFSEFESKNVREYTATPSVDSVSAPTPIYDPSCRYEYSRRKQSPATSMSQFGARQFTKWLSLLTETDYRLPLESEWKYACLAGQKPPDVKELREQAVYGYTKPDQYQARPDDLILRVGTLQPNAWGIFDMRGNVAEFVMEDVAADPTKRVPNDYRKHRAYGGSFDGEAKDCRWDSYVLIDRDWWEEEANLPQSPMWMATIGRHDTIGFRIVRPGRPMSAAEKKVAWEADSEQLAEDVKMQVDYDRGKRGRVDSRLPSAIERFIDRPVWNPQPWKWQP